MKINRSFRFALVLVFVQALTLQSFAQLAANASQADVNAAIRKEGMENSKIMNTLHHFTDLYGPRLTGSPNHVEAAKWALREMQSWGFSNTNLHSWDFGHPGWVNERAFGMMNKPVTDALTFEVLGWTPSTKGVVRGAPVHLVIPTKPNPENPRSVLPPTQEELNAYFEEVKASVNGKIVFVGRPAVIPVTIEPRPRRLNDEETRRRFNPDPSATPQPSPQATPPQPARPRPTGLNFQQIGEQLDKFLVDNNAALRVNDAAMDLGLMRAFNNRTFDVAKVVPTIVMRNEDFGRVVRLLERKHDVQLEFDVRNRTVPSGVTSYNAIAEIPGTDKKDEVVMLGGHLDSWHAATGATDNAIGCATMMEAARILKAIGVKPRRTIRVALWSGEEQGLLGSQAYVRDHFGSAENPKADFGKFNGYFNIDSGTGRARGMSVFGPPEASSFLREVLAPFADLGVAGAVSTRGRNIGGSDHTSFSNAGLPGIGIQQDPIEYSTTTWHTNLDTYERIIESDAKASAIVIAAAVYALAMSDNMLPRFAPADMPTAPAPRP